MVTAAARSARAAGIRAGPVRRVAVTKAGPGRRVVAVTKAGPVRRAVVTRVGRGRRAVAVTKAGPVRRAVAVTKAGPVRQAVAGTQVGPTAAHAVVSAGGLGQRAPSGSARAEVTRAAPPAMTTTAALAGHPGRAGPGTPPDPPAGKVAGTTRRVATPAVPVTTGPRGLAPHLPVVEITLRGAPGRRRVRRARLGEGSLGVVAATAAAIMVDGPSPGTGHRPSPRMSGTAAQ